MALPSHPQTETTSQEAALPAIFDDAVAALESHPEALRIKKLIFCLCNNPWENDLDILNGVSLAALLRDLIQLNPNQSSLENSLYRLVNSLNRAQLYATPAAAILEQLKILYQAQILPETEGTSVNNEAQTLSILLDTVAAQLQQHEEQVRIKKMLLAACKERWENDLSTLQKYSVRELVSELYNCRSDIAEIEASLTTIANGLNKPEVYLSIAQIIRDCLAILYEDRKQRAEPPAGKEYDIFELRLNILQYTNPLRVKLLLFAVLDADWLEESQDWSILENFTLDSLLRQILDAGQDFESLKSQLYQVSELFPEPEENQQAAASLLRIIQPLL